MDRRGGNVEVVEEMLPHEAVVALQGVRLHRPILVEVERDDRLERHPLLAVQADQFVVDADGRRAGRKAQHRLLAGRRPRLHEIGDLAGHRPAGIERLVIDRDRDPLDRVYMRKRAAVDRCGRNEVWGAAHGISSRGLGQEAEAGGEG